jgi:hypothetical protein
MMRSLQNVANLYLGKTLTYQKCIHGEVRSRPISFSSESAVPKRKDRMNNTVIFPVVLHGYEAWALRLRAGGGGAHRPRLSEKRALRIFGPKREKVTGD